MKIPFLSQWFKSDDLDDGFLDSYRTVLLGQYNGLDNMVKDDRAKAEAEAVAKLDPKDVGWEDLYRLELAILKLEPVQQLRRRAWVLREEYGEVASPAEVKAYLASHPPDPETATEVDLRADLIRLQEELNWRYIVTWVLESFRGEIIRKVVRWTLVGLVIVGVLVCSPLPQCCFACAEHINLPFLALIVVPGIIGGLISTIRRLQTVKLDGNADLDLAQLEQGNTSTYLSPFLGGIFALLLFVLFAGDFLTGNLFPKLSFDNLLGHQETDPGEFAKLAVWCFIAGFAEKFVPDRLDKLVGQAGAETKPQGPSFPKLPSPPQDPDKKA